MFFPQPDSDTGNSKVSVVLVAPDDDRRRAIAKVISGTRARIVREFSECPVGTILTKLIESDCDVIMVDLDAGAGWGIDLIETICTRNALVTVMACSIRNEADVVIRAMQAGAREFLTEPVAPATITEAFVRAAARRRTVTPERPRGKILVFQGTKGGTGVTTLATNFAVALAKENAGEVALVDLHPQLGEIALGLGIESQFSIADALGNAGRLDSDFLSTLLIRHESGLMVLASSDEYGLHRSLERGTERLLRVMREQFAFVVVDAGSCSGNIPDALFDGADTIYLVTEVNLPSLRNARRLIAYFVAKESSVGLDIVLNRFNSRTVEIDEESARKALSRPVDWKIPNDYMAVRSAQNLGIPLVEQDSPISRVLCQMVRAASGKPANLPEQKGLAALKGDKWKFWTSTGIRPLSTARS